jgi:hypothetical protein
MLRDAIQPFVVDDGNAAARIGQAIFQLGTGPPRIERGDDGAGENCRVERHRPLGQVAHGHGHAVALVDAVAYQLLGQRRGRLRERAIADALLFVDHEGLVAPGCGDQEQIAQRWWRILPDRGRDAPDHARLGFERRARRGQPGVRFGQGHDRPLAGAGLRRPGLLRLLLVLLVLLLLRLLRHAWPPAKTIVRW